MGQEGRSQIGELQFVLSDKKLNNWIITASARWSILPLDRALAVVPPQRERNENIGTVPAAH